MTKRKSVKAEQTACETCDGTAELRSKAGTISAGLFDGLVKGSIRNIGTLALKDEVRLQQFVVFVHNEIRIEIRSEGWP